MKPALFALVLTVAACQGAEPAGEAFTSDEDGYACEIPQGWEPRRDRGSTIFASPDHPRRTLVVRAVPRAANAEEAPFLRATDTVMADLPGVELTGRRALDGSVRGVRYDLTFEPPNARERYRRTHVVVFFEHRVLHLLDTAPVSVAVDDAAITRLLATLREEV